MQASSLLQEDPNLSENYGSNPERMLTVEDRFQQFFGQTETIEQKQNLSV